MTVQSSNNGLGRYGEEVAARWLAEGGLQILERNWRCVEGELDIVALDGDTLAVCEVKTRSERGFQQPSEGIDRAKADRLRRLAERWLGERWPGHFESLAEVVAAGWRLAGNESAAGGESNEGNESNGRSQSAGGRAGSDSGGGSEGTDEHGGLTPPGKDALPDWPAPTPPGGVRIDLIAVINRVKGPAQVEHLRGVI